MKIAFVSAIPSCPANGGNRARQNSLSEELMKRGHEVHFVFMPNRHAEDFDAAAHEAFYGKGRVHVLSRKPLGNFIYYAKRTFLRLLTNPSSVIQKKVETKRGWVDETYYKGFTAQIRALHEALGFDCAMATYVFYSKALEAFPEDVFKILDTQDCVSGFLPPSQEAKGLRRADAVLAIQDEDAATFRKLLKKQSRKVITLSQFSEQGPAISAENTLGASFLGSSFAANREGVTWFTQAVLPRIVEKCPDFKFYVAGSICKDVPDAPHIVKLGFVPSPVDAFRLAPISLNPILSGTGVKVKFIDSLLMGLPVVSTQWGVMAIADHYLTGVKVVSDTDAEGFANSVIALYQDRDLRLKLAQASYKAGAQWNRDQLSAMDILLERAGSRLKSIPGVPLISRVAQDQSPARRLVDSYTDA